MYQGPRTTKYLLMFDLRNRRVEFQQFVQKVKTFSCRSINYIPKIQDEIANPYMAPWWSGLTR